MNTYVDYQETLVLAEDKGYKITTFKDYKPHPKVLLLRHDIDFDPLSAARMAKIESELGVKASYFVRLHATYNPFSFKIYNALKTIRDFGHEIGLHAENLDFAMLFNQSPSQVLHRDKETLERMLEVRILGVSGHKDLIGARNSDFWKNENTHAYDFGYHVFQPKFTRDAIFVSDAIGASGLTDNKPTLKQVLNKAPDKIYATLHPCYWQETHYLIDSMRV